MTCGTRPRQLLRPPRHKVSAPDAEFPQARGQSLEEEGIWLCPGRRRDRCLASAWAVIRVSRVRGLGEAWTRVRRLVVGAEGRRRRG
jgi:hypothetical protein